MECTVEQLGYSGPCQLLMTCLPGQDHTNQERPAASVIAKVDACAQVFAPVTSLYGQCNTAWELRCIGSVRPGLSLTMLFLGFKERTSKSGSSLVVWVTTAECCPLGEGAAGLS